jgi:hypothetical protein
VGFAHGLERDARTTDSSHLTSSQTKHEYRKHNPSHDRVEPVPLNGEGEDRKYNPGHRGCDQEEKP